MLQVGRPAPSFSLPSTSGRTVSLSGLRGRKTVLYFYPRDDTPGCTKEACDFRDNLARVRSAGADVFGVSKDAGASHAKFRTKYSLPFDLLTDADNAVAKAYSAYGKKILYGKSVEGTIRSTFLIDEKGRIAQVWSPVKVDGHVDQVLAALTGKGAAATKVAAATAPANGRISSRKSGTRSAPSVAKKNTATKIAPKSLVRARKLASKTPIRSAAAKSAARKPAKKKLAHRV